MHTANKAIMVDTRRSVCGLGWSWLALASALAVHVTDEALTDFLSVYNPAVHSLRARVPWLPLPTFGFGEWIGGLALLVIVVFALAPAAFRGARWLARVAVPFSVLMVANGCGHLAASAYFGRWMPGASSSPLLIAAALAVAITSIRTLRARRVDA